jgi:hypothetical protein
VPEKMTRKKATGLLRIYFSLFFISIGNTFSS